MNVATEEAYKLCVKNGFYEFVLAPTGKRRRKTFPDSVLRTCIPDACHQEGATQASSVPDATENAGVPDSGALGQDPDKESRCTTTLMLRNVPCKVNLEIMEVVLMQLGFEGKYDYLYFPTRKSGSNLGFGFVNFRTEDDAVQFDAAFTGYVFGGIQSNKQCYVTIAAVQGREANLRLHATSA
eukprot:TRINITY_DN9213_c0_g1_i2.p1 TRINITY_DN9213_c0_g1~~TRINITY_DN9213_c0_g1_i2.p1  ORF type:complete len:206 (+),score=38.68 TRINITY_DN9213_c0_g1_i2:70-618(+)